MGKDKVKIKICGLRSLSDISFINEFHPDFAGFIFAESKRKVTAEFAEVMRKKLDPTIAAIGVFVNQGMDEIQSLEKRQIIQFIQLHGDESADYVKKLKKQTKLPIIKVIHMKAEEAQTKAESQALQAQITEFEPCCDYFLFDTIKAGSYGGTGRRFSLENLPKTRKPFFLAGGITPENVMEFYETQGIFAMDVNSGVETDGRKDGRKIKELFDRVRQND